MDKSRNKKYAWKAACIITVVAALLSITALSAGLYMAERRYETLEQEYEKYRDKAEQEKMIGEGQAQEETKQPISIEQMKAGDILEAERTELPDWSGCFLVSEIGGDILGRIHGRSYVENMNIALEDLRYVKLWHYNYNHEIQAGEMIVHKNLVEDYRDIFMRLFQAEYEIQSMHLIDDYWTGDGVSSDSASIDANNTSAFCYRVVPDSAHLSNHAYGCAIDINPQQNPYITITDGRQTWSHDNAEQYIDRSRKEPHMIDHDDLCYQLFAEHGFTWGGDWQNPIDYQHFEKKVYE